MECALGIFSAIIRTARTATCHKDASREPRRSAGYEHIVALSLVAALQRCAPSKGPIFMDMRRSAFEVGVEAVGVRG